MEFEAVNFRGCFYRPLATLFQSTGHLATLFLSGPTGSSCANMNFKASSSRPIASNLDRGLLAGAAWLRLRRLGHDKRQ
jgi:hypothetical protein